MKTFTKFSLAAASAALLVLKAQAVTITLTLAGAIGYVDPGTPAQPGDEVNYINTLVAQAANTTVTTPAPGSQTFARTSVVTTGLPTAITTGATKDESQNPDYTDISVGIFDYAIGKYGTRSYVWYIGGLGSANAFTLPGTDDGVKLIDE